MIRRLSHFRLAKGGQATSMLYRTKAPPERSCLGRTHVLLLTYPTRWIKVPFMNVPSKEKVLEHLEPVLVTFIVTTFLLLFDNYLVPAVNVHLGEASPFLQLQRRLEPHIAHFSQQLEGIVQSVHHWIHARQGRIMSATSSEYEPDMSSFLQNPIKPLTAFTKPYNSQDDSPLFQLPGEILDLIVEHALTPHPDFSRPYQFSTCYRRPGHFAPMTTPTGLLQTCQAIYVHHWYVPWTLSSHTFYLTAMDRRPASSRTIESMMRACYLIENLHPDAPSRRKQISHIQVFAQLWALEGDHGLTRIFRIPHFNPRSVTITIRHTDWWFWEWDHPLHFMGTNFVADLRFPASVENVYLEFESLERKKSQIDWMANYVTKKWHFTRTDNVHLVAGFDNRTSTKATSSLTNKTESWEVTRWKGSATWGNQRWVRDEDDKEPNILSYYVATISFHSVRLVDDPEGYKRRYEREMSMGPSVTVDDSVGEQTRMTGNLNYLMTEQLIAAGILGEVDEETGEAAALEVLPASEALRRVQEMERETGQTSGGARNNDDSGSEQDITDHEEEQGEEEEDNDDDDHDHDHDHDHDQESEEDDMETDVYNDEDIHNNDTDDQN